MAVVVEDDGGVMEERVGDEVVPVTERALEDSACTSQFDVIDGEESVPSLKRFLLTVSSRPSNEGEAARFVLDPVRPCGGGDDGRLVASSACSTDILAVVATPPNDARSTAMRTSSWSM